MSCLSRLVQLAKPPKCELLARSQGVHSSEVSMYTKSSFTIEIFAKYIQYIQDIYKIILCCQDICI